MKRIYLEGRSAGWSLHSLYHELITYPPEGYEFLTDETIETANKINTLRLLSSKLAYNRLYDFSNYFRPAFYYFYYQAREKRRTIKNVDLTYSSQHIIFRKEPWIVDLEHVGALVAYGKLDLFRHVIEKALASKYCKKIMPWSDIARKTLILNLDYKKFEHKIETVRLAVPPKHFTKKHNNDKIKLLFVGTANAYNIYSSFDLKGGKEVLEAFSILDKKYSNLELVMRSHIPHDLMKKYKNLSNNMRILDKVLPWNVLEEEFKSADIFLFPGHSTPGMTILDAMSYEMPIITTDVWGNPELVEDGKTGFLIKKSRKVPYFMKSPKGVIYYTPAFFRAIRKTDHDVARELAKKASVLIENNALRLKMGRNARREIETGIFSIQKRNEKLKSIFDEATTN